MPANYDDQARRTGRATGYPMPMRPAHLAFAALTLLACARPRAGARVRPRP